MDKSGNSDKVREAVNSRFIAGRFRARSLTVSSSSEVRTDLYGRPSSRWDKNMKQPKPRRGLHQVW